MSSQTVLVSWLNWGGVLESGISYKCASKFPHVFPRGQLRAEDPIVCHPSPTHFLRGQKPKEVEGKPGFDCNWRQSSISYRPKSINGYACRSCSAIAGTTRRTRIEGSSASPKSSIIFSILKNTIVFFVIKKKCPIITNWNGIS